MKNNKTPIANPHVVLREEFDDWAILFDPDSGRGFGLSPTGAYVWKLLDGKHTSDALLEKVSRHAEDVHEKASVHIEAFIDALIAEGLAGFDNSDSGPSTDGGLGKTSPPGYVSEASPFRYEPPQLVDFRGGRAAQGSCGNGSSDSGTCNAGNFAGCSCNSGFSGFSPACCGGSGDDTNCGTGSCVKTCCTGFCDGQQANCGPGTGADGRYCGTVGNCARNPCSYGHCVDSGYQCS